MVPGVNIHMRTYTLAGRTRCREDRGALFFFSDFPSCSTSNWHIPAVVQSSLNLPGEGWVGLMQWFKALCKNKDTSRQLFRVVSVVSVIL